MTKKDTRELILRREALAIFGTAVGAAGSLAIFGCGSDDAAVGGADGGTGSDGSTTDTADGATSSTDASATGTDGAVTEVDSGLATCNTIADETSGPYPDTKGMISSSTYYRSDITEDRTGTPLTLIFTVIDVGSGCAAVAGANVEIWHCDKDGIYSEYANSMNAGSTSTTYLRGVQTTNSTGQVTFKTIYPGWYNPRATHVHVEVFSGTTLKKTTQIGFPDATNTAVYGQTSLYTKGQNTSTDDTDQVFGGTATATGNGDGGGHVYQIASITGDNTNGYVASIVIGLASFG